MADTAGRDGRGLMATLVVTLLLTLIGAGAGFAVGTLLKPTVPGVMAAGAPAAAPSPGTAADRPAGDAAPPSPEAPLAEVKVVPFPPVVTTLVAPQGKWIRLEGAILVGPASGTAPDLLAERSGEQILSYLRTLSLDQVEGPSGLAALRDDLRETLVTLSRGEVQGVLIHGLIVE